MLSDAFTRLQGLLRQLFQFESKELDFGIYRILNHKRGAIEDFIGTGLAAMVDDALSGGATARESARAEELRQATNRIKETFGEYAISPKGELNEAFQETPLGKQYAKLHSPTRSSTKSGEGAGRGRGSPGSTSSSRTTWTLG